jgi:hypothetical protein
VAQNDFRIHVRSDDAGALVGRLDALDAQERGRFAVSRDGDDVFVYASSYADAQRASELVHAAVRDGGAAPEISAVEQWLDAEDRWSDEPGDGTWEEDELEHGHAPWEVRVDCGSRAAAGELAERLAGEGYKPLRRWSYLIVGTTTREDAEALAGRLHGSVEPGGDLVWETMPGNPFAVFGGMGGSGTPGG